MAYNESLRWLNQLHDPAPTPTASHDAALRRLDRPLPRRGLPPSVVVSDLVRDVTIGQPKHPFGNNRNAAHSAGLAALWLAAVWSQHTPSAATASVITALEQVTARWVLDLFGLPGRAILASHANWYLAELRSLTTAREQVLRGQVTDLPVTLLMGEAHYREGKKVRDALAGGAGLSVVELDSDNQGRMNPEALRRSLGAHDGPVIVCARTGHADTGTADPLDPIVATVKAARSARPAGDLWLHVDGAQGMRTAISPGLRHRVRGYEHADSWSMDTRGWLPTPVECGISVIREETRRRLSPGPSRIPAQLKKRADEDNLRAVRVLTMFATIRQLGQRAIIESVEESSFAQLRDEVCLFSR